MEDCESEANMSYISRIYFKNNGGWGVGSLVKSTCYENMSPVPSNHMLSYNSL